MRRVVFIPNSLIFCEFGCFLNSWKFWHPHYSEASSFTALCCGKNKFLLLILNLLCTRFSRCPVNPPYLCPLCCSWFYTLHCTALSSNMKSPYPLVNSCRSCSTDHFCCTSLDLLLFCCITVCTGGRDDNLDLHQAFRIHMHHGLE